MANIFNTIYELVEKGGFQFDDAFREYNVFSTLGICTFLIVLIGSLFFRLYVTQESKTNLRTPFFYKIVMGITVAVCGLICFIVPNFLTGIFIFNNALWLLIVNVVFALVLYFSTNLILKNFFTNTDFIPVRMFSKKWFKEIKEKLFK